MRSRAASAGARRLVRQAESKPLVEALKAWLESKLLAVSEKSVIAEARRRPHRDGHNLVNLWPAARLDELLPWAWRCDGMTAQKAAA